MTQLRTTLLRFTGGHGPDLSTSRARVAGVTGCGGACGAACGAASGAGAPESAPRIAGALSRSSSFRACASATVLLA